MNIAHSVPTAVTGISFTFLSSEDIRDISVKQVVNPVLLDELNRPSIGGLYDPAFGPSERSDICTTCRLSYFTCPGHFGHIELPAPVFHPLFMPQMYNLLRGACMFCHHFRLPRTVVAKFIAKLRLLEYGLIDASQQIDDFNIHVSKRSTETTNESGDEGIGSKNTQTGDESPEHFAKRLHLFVSIHIRRSKATRDTYKDGIVYQMRKDLISDFQRMAITKKCPNCGNPAYTFRKEGYTKIIEYDPSKQQKGLLNRKRPNVLLQEQTHAFARAPTTNRSSDDSDGMEVDDESVDSEEEGEGDDLDPNQEDEVTKDAEENLPRAANGRIKTKRGRNERVMAPEECRAHLRRLFSKESLICSLLFGRHGPFSPLSSQGLSLVSADIFFMELIPVTPTRFRPAAKMGEMMFEHPQNELLTKILQTSYRLRDLNVDLRAASEKRQDFDVAQRRKVMSALLDVLVQLQIDVNSFMDSSKNPTPMRQGKQPPLGIKQGLEKKEGLFRKNMMGKRVNYAARSVISPDVNIEPNEIGVPPVFAQKLTYPEPVTHANVHLLRQLVTNGPANYPGATMIEDESGDQISLSNKTYEQRAALANQLLTPQEGHGGRRLLRTTTAAKNKKVYRHLQDGDILILNRQPTLHKPSMMAHHARVLRGEKTIRMHYANCNSYNADFDGDEMNIHFPQNEIARAEASMIANTNNQYLVPTSGNPLRGLIQDHVVAGVWMTCQDAFFEREEYFQLLYGALRPESDEFDCSKRLVTLPPSVWKPRPLWTGKQIISTLLKNITPSHFEGLNLNAGTKIGGEMWGKGSKEDEVIFLDGELLCGVLDKAAFGASTYGMVHSVYELYGSDVAGQLLGSLSRLFTKFLQHRAFTCRMDDLILTPKGDAARDKILQDGRNLGTEGAKENFPSLESTSEDETPMALTKLLHDILRDDEKMAGLDMTVKTKLSDLTAKISKECIPERLFRQFPHNHMQTMTLSGAKGSAVNARQISCALGQQELEGRRVPVMVSGKTLPSFRPFETKAIAGGYIGSRFLTGIKPQEFYFHCMAGREGLIDTAVKTSRSGYLQRCLIKHLEGIRIHYDNTVRGSDSSVYQFQYGGDALDVTKQMHLYKFKFVAQNEFSMITRLRPRDVLENRQIDPETAAHYMKKVLKKKFANDTTTLSQFYPHRYIGSTSDRFAAAVDKYIKYNEDGLIRQKDKEDGLKRRTRLMMPKNFKLLMNVKYMRSLVEPGEAVGLLASQGVGEPSTQMTLNTFHFAGHGAANVTLGIPRLREIVMTAARKPKTPSMTMKVRPETSADDIDSFCKRASRVTLSQVIDTVSVQEELVVEGEARHTQLTVNLNFFPVDEYRAEYDIEPPEILSCFGTLFPLALKREIQTELKKLDADLRSQIADLGKGKKVRDEGEDEEGMDEGDVNEDPKLSKRDADQESEDGDGDADEDKRARQKKEQASYDSDEEDEETEEDKQLNAEIEAAYADTESVNENAPNPSIGASSSTLKSKIGPIRGRFFSNLNPATSFEFTPEKCTFKIQFKSDMPKLLFVGIIEKTCRMTVLREIPGIADCFKVEEKRKDSMPVIKLMTNGSNLSGLWNFASAHEETILEDDETYSNDIYAVLMTYGVEMARAAIIQEMSNVFGVYKIDVNRRHLELIADYMTFDGGYKPFNRKGISTHSSPLLKASFETTAAFLSDATLYGDYDDLTSPSGNIVLGKPNRTGTGVFDVVMRTQK